MASLAGPPRLAHVDDEGTATQETSSSKAESCAAILATSSGAADGAVSNRLRPPRELSVHPHARMTNTTCWPATTAPEDILRSVKRGPYAVNFGGGQVDIPTKICLFGV